MGAQFVLDNSVVMTWCFKDERDRYAASVLDSLENGEAIVPAIWPLEVGNVLLAAERRGRLFQTDSVRFLSMLSGLPILVEAEGAERMFREILALAREYQLTTYDASYLDLAMRLALPLATRDVALLKAAKKCRMRLYAPRTN
ncbi:MAG: type II toxin-antitoxin system VapC family toxin [Candidatus Hydrogenedentes bacterium]|nr:type II toxin-antitoxin system VapC family toxin [Candidatus Hydrogenedentota bacterium]MBI3117494.1 type II toxin-antitoxin system VapC family toxin [Candidatus Hydrogenedentota bacterium]